MTSLQPPTDGRHAMLCGIVAGLLMQHLPLIYKAGLSVRIVDDDEGAHLAGCVIEVGEDGVVYEVEIRPLISASKAP